MSDMQDTAMITRLMQTMKKSALLPRRQQEICARHPGDIELGHLREQICAEAMTLAGQGRGPSELMAALLRTDLGQLCPMAAEVHHQTTITRAAEDTSAEMANRSPVFVFNKMMFICPVGRLDRLGLQLVSDRALRLATGHRIKNALLNLEGLVADQNIIDQWTGLLKEELKTQKIKLLVQE
jgi:hypothetical protein